MLCIESDETYYIDENNNIGRQSLIPSDSWKLLGAIEYNNFGNVIRRYSVEDIRAGKVVWRHKNGKPKVFILDNDHGTVRQWTRPINRVIEIDSQYCYSCRMIQHDREYCWNCRKPIDKVSKVGQTITTYPR